MIDLPPAGPIYVSRSEADTGRFFDAKPPLVKTYLQARDRRLLLDGPLGTGKTRIGLEKVRACCLKYPGCRWILLRSVRKWLTHSALVTWEEKVLEPGLLKPDRIKRGNRSEYTFRNGSVVVCAGLDDPQAVFSAEYDGALLIEATEVDQDTAEKVDGRLRNGRMPYQQFLMDCNPGSPTHWLHRAFETGWLRRMPMRHTDNPALYLNGAQTKYGREYLSRLDDLTGVRRARLRDGLWAQAEGAVYEGWDAAIHVVGRFDIPAHWRWWWSVDFGFTNPLAWQFWAEDDDGRLYLVHEIYQTRRLVRDVAEWARKITAGLPRPQAIITDHSPEAMGQIEEVLGITCTAADKADKKGGIQDVADRLVRQPDGKPRLMLFRDALVHQVDPDLLATGKPTKTESEFDSYVWNPRLAKCEEPIKEHDHGMDACLVGGTMVETLDGPKPIEAVQVDEMVMTRRGYHKVIASGMTSRSAAIVSVRIAGSVLEGTSNHPVYVLGHGFLPLGQLKPGMRVLCLEIKPCERGLLAARRRLKSRSSMATSIAGTRLRNRGRFRSISARAMPAEKPVSIISIATSGNSTTEKSQMECKFTTKTAIRSTTQSTTWNCNHPKSMPRNIWNRTAKEAVSFINATQSNSGRCENPPKDGMPRKPGEDGTASTPSKLPKQYRTWRRSARFARRSIWLNPTAHPFPNSALPTARRPHEGYPEPTSKNGDAGVEKYSSATSISQPKAVPRSVVAVTQTDRMLPVYNLEVGECPEYYANGILVHNCRYLCRHLSDQKPGRGFDGYGVPEVKRVQW